MLARTGILRKRPSVLRSFGEIADALLDRMTASAANPRPSSEIDPLSALSAPKIARATSVRPEPTRPAKPRISPLLNVKLTLRK